MEILDTITNILLYLYENAGAGGAEQVNGRVIVDSSVLASRGSGCGQSATHATSLQQPTDVATWQPTGAAA